jgi:hypothetical protein
MDNLLSDLFGYEYGIEIVQQRQRVEFVEMYQGTGIAYNAWRRFIHHRSDPTRGLDE